MKNSFKKLKKAEVMELYRQTAAFSLEDIELKKKAS